MVTNPMIESKKNTKKNKSKKKLLRYAAVSRLYQGVINGKLVVWGTVVWDFRGISK